MFFSSSRFLSSLMFLLFVSCGGGGSSSSSGGSTGIIPVKQISAGSFHTCALLNDDTVKCWGYGYFGRLGYGSGDNLGDGSNEMGDNLPAIDLGSGRTAKSVAAGEYHTCALLDNDTVKCWGYSQYGQLGQGNISNLGDGINEMGDNLSAIDLGSGRTAKQIAVGGTHTCALLDNDTVKCWGRGLYGQLGQGNVNNLGDGINEMGDNLPAIDLGSGRTAKQVDAGSSHTCALLDNDTVKCWGHGQYGQLGQEDDDHLGDGINEMGDNLSAINLGSGRTAKQIDVGGSHTCALLDDDTVKCWGWGLYGQLGSGGDDNLGDGPNEMGNNLSAIGLGSGRTVKSVAVGDDHTCALLDNDTVKCWGSSQYGQLGQEGVSTLGDGSNEMGDNLSATDLGSGRTALAVVAGQFHTCALLDDDTVKCWGRGSYGQLGQEDVSNLGDGSNEMGDNLPAINLGSL